jgi:succinoglycan biosynthesis transport protein ExoP
VVFLPVVAGAAAYAQSLPTTYESIAVLAFTPRPNTQVGGDTLRLVLPKYIVFAQSVDQLTKASQAYDVARTTLEQNIDISIPAETANLRIAVTLTDAERAKNVANLLAAQTLRRAKIDPLLDAQVVQRADVPSAPSGPNRNLYRIAGIIAGLVLAIGAVALAEGLHPRVLNAGEAGEVAGLDVWASLPRSSTMRRGRRVDSRVSAAMRSLRNQLVRKWTSSAPHGAGVPLHAAGRVVVVTSPDRHQGTTTVAALLVRSICELGYQVLAIDSNVNDPALTARLRSANVATLQSVLDDADKVAALATTQEPIVVVGGDDDGYAASDMLSLRAAQLFRSATSHFDAVVVDAPALLDDELTHALVTEADDVVLVVGHHCSQARLRDAGDILLEPGVTAGVVTNQVGARSTA